MEFYSTNAGMQVVQLIYDYSQRNRTPKMKEQAKKIDQLRKENPFKS
ncbi:hypothetical protein AVDCRST_MAG92-5117 [uncultured Coleofasciculus sp.]|uniref:Uncharacterized protein n=1 Tax=uncultured Coleofasciculus sp. TaxID=1267456 RepID=A0A6J4KDT1_9CYAN|nr:hypothetical protein AVDCRST_MAG92-5117 [uncultured Coleofasciculus sp.]